MRTLKEVKCKSTVTVVKLHGEGAVKRRIKIWASQKGRKSMSARWRLWGTLWR